MEKVGLIVKRMKTLPVGMEISNREVKDVFHVNEGMIDEKNVTRYLLSLVLAFEDGDITRNEFVEIIEGFKALNKVNLKEQTIIYDIIYHEIPDMSLFCVDKSIHKEDTEFYFRKAMKDFSRKQIEEKRLHNILYDPIEEEEYYQRIELDVERKLKKELKDVERRRGFCHLYWYTKKRILKEDYNIDWKTPAEMNPHIIFD